MSFSTDLRKLLSRLKKLFVAFRIVFAFAIEDYEVLT